MQVGILIKVVLPLALFIIMLGMGLSLTVTDFKRVLKQPKAVMVGLVCQMIMLPLIAFGIIMMFNPTPVLAVGLLVLAFCPGGTTSNMMTYLAKADLALSVTLTAIVSLVTPITIPLLTKWAMVAFMGNEQVIELPLLKTILQLCVITVIPVGIGMLLNKKFPVFAQRAETPIKYMSVAFLFIVIGGIAKQNWDALGAFFAQIGPAALTLNVGTMTLGFLVARYFNLGHKQSVTIGIEVGIQNGTTALLVTGTLLANPIMSIAPSIYSLMMFGTGALFAVTVNKLAPREGVQLKRQTA